MTNAKDYHYSSPMDFPTTNVNFHALQKKIKKNKIDKTARMPQALVDSPTIGC